MNFRRAFGKWVCLLLIALMAIPSEAATPHAALLADEDDRPAHESQSAPHGLGQVEYVTSDGAFEPALLARVPTPAEPALAREEDREPPALSNPSAASQPHEDMVKWFGIFGFVLLLMRGARRR